MRLRTVLINCIATFAVSLYAHTPVRAQDTVVAGYTANQNTEVVVSGPAVSTSTIPPSGMPSGGTVQANVGNTGGINYYAAQRIYVSSANTITQIQLRFAANSGSPVGTITLELQTGTADQPSGTVVSSTTHTPIGNTVNTIPFSTPALNSGWYWLIIKPTTLQASGVRWNIPYTAIPSPYGDGVYSQFLSTGSQNASILNDLHFVLTLSSARTRIAQSFYVALPALVSTVQIYGKQTGAVTGTLTAGIYTNNDGRPSDVLVDSDATSAVSEAEISTTGYQWIDFEFADLVELSPGNYWLVVESNRTEVGANYIGWGSDSSIGYIQGEQWSESGGTWVYQTRDSVFQLLGSNDTGVSAYTEAITLDSGQTAAAIYTLTAGDLIIKDFLLVLIGINVLAFFAQIFGLFRRGR